MKPGKHFLSVADLKKGELEQVFLLAEKLKKNTGRESCQDLLKNKTLAMVFEKPSLRTRVSFEAGMTQLGGHAIYLGPSDIQMGRRETPADVARNLERMVDIVMARVFDHSTVEELASNSKIPVINGLSDLEHPCQALADLLTVSEHKGGLAGLTLAFVGDGGNNVTHSLALLSGILGLHFRCGSPPGYQMSRLIVEKAERIGGENGLEFKETENPEEAVRGADVVVTDTWISMGDEKEKAKRLKIFPPYQVNEKLFSLAKKDAIFMHCLPAYRHYEVTPEVIDGRRSVVFDEAENRLHAQKGLICHLLGIKV